MNPRKKKIIAVVGATGAQGGGLVRAICADPNSPYAVRAITRDPHTPCNRALAAQGAEVVAADLNDVASVERAFAGAQAAFCVTFFWDHLSPKREIEQARHMARAAKRAGLEQVIWSTLEDTRRFMPLDDPRMPTLMERYKVPHLDGKGEADACFLDAGIPTTFLLTSFYWENFIHLGAGPQRVTDDQLVLSLPIGAAKLPGIAAEDIGRCAYGLLLRGSEFIGRRVGVAGEHLDGTQMAQAFSRALGQTVHYNQMTPEAYRLLDFPGAEDLGNMFHFKRDFEREYRLARDVEQSRQLNPRLQSFEAWLSANARRIPLSAPTLAPA